MRHNYKTQIQIAELWGDNLTQQNVSKACQKLGITRKKNLRLWIKKLSGKTKIYGKTINSRSKKLVYVDEAGFDNCTGLWLWL